MTERKKKFPKINLISSFGSKVADVIFENTRENLTRLSTMTEFPSDSLIKDATFTRLDRESVPEARSIFEEVKGVDDFVEGSLKLLSEQYETSSAEDRKRWEDEAGKIFDPINRATQNISKLGSFYTEETASLPIEERRDKGTQALFEALISLNNRENKNNAVGPSTIRLILEIWDKRKERSAVETIEAFERLQVEIDEFTQEVVDNLSEGGGFGSFVVGVVVGRMSKETTPPNTPGILGRRRF